MMLGDFHNHRLEERCDNHNFGHQADYKMQATPVAAGNRLEMQGG